MPRIVLASGLSRWLRSAAASGPAEFQTIVTSQRLDQALDALFQQHPQLRGYVVDEHGTVRRHVAIFIDGQSITDKSALAVPLRESSEIYILQALSGG
ncbi:MoaD/ThiS family protein [Tahibacter amnicola]|uniref:MoaD/ThiS family protein n=1 Tax=Tahibacter amnicola TaxID=2976241 RepID=A0ABY6BDX3_9GAMM|nr:MoaD/ThiS family protein [Tahibacter amnicola]UXI67747.1 MoaD/ThiS family protein [Tahibacter amnicola]